MELVHVQYNLKAQRYRGEIVQPQIMHLINRLKELFQQKNARPHAVHLTMRYLEQNNINALLLPFKSPELNPVV